MDNFVLILTGIFDFLGWLGGIAFLVIVFLILFAMKFEDEDTWSE